MPDFIENANRLLSSIDSALKLSIDVNKQIDEEKTVYDFKERKAQYHQKLIMNNLESLKHSAAQLKVLTFDDSNKNLMLAEIVDLLSQLEKSDIKGMKPKVEKILGLSDQLDIKKHESIVKFPKNLPSDIREDVTADLHELDKCYASGCYRSCTILCGRILETVLHRKYYETTGLDILEKNPGIGLGNLIGKLSEKGVKMDPGLTQQIHLINQVRVFSVHKKQEAFSPSQAQTQAMILYSMDILDKVFRR